MIIETYAYMVLQDMDYSRLDRVQLLKEIEALQKENEQLKLSVYISQKENIISDDERKLLRLLVEAIPAAAVYLDDTKMFFNKAAEELTGYKASEITTVSGWFNLLFNDSTQAFSIYNKAKGEGFPTSVTIPLTTKDGAIQYVEFSAYKYAECEIWIMNNGTAKKVLEKTLVEKNTLLKSILESPKGMIIFSLDKEYCYTAFTLSHKEVMKKIWNADIAAGLCMLDIIKNPIDKENAKLSFDRALSGEYFIECEEYGADDLYRTIWENRYSPMYSENNEIIGLTVFVTDISERIKAKRELTESESRINTLFDSVPVLIWMSGTDTTSSFFNKQWLEYRGRSIEEEQGLGWMEGIHPDDLEMCKKVFEESFKKRQPLKVEYRLKRADGEYCYMLDNGVPRYLPTGEFAGFIGSCIDISHIKKVEEALLKSKTRNKALLSALPDMMFMFSREGYLIDYNAEDNASLYMKPAEFLGKNISDILPQDTASLTMEMINKASSTGEMQTFEYELEFDGLKFYEARLVPCGFDRFIAVIRDVTEKRHAEKALKESAQIQKLIFEGSNDLVCVQNLEGRYLFIIGSDQFDQKADDIIGKMPHDVLKIISASEVMADFSKVLSTGKRLTKESHIELKGQSVWFLVAMFPLKNELGDITSIATVARNITQLKQAESVLRKFSRAVEQSSASIIITDINGNIEFINKKTSELTGYAPEELIGKNPRIFKSGETLPEEYKKLWQTIKSGGEWRGEFHNKKKNNELFWELASLSALRDENEIITHFLAIKEDITFRKEMEGLLRSALDKAEESNKLKSNLLNNMSHELRTPMNGILGFASILKEEILDPIQKDLLEKLIRSSKRLMCTLNSILDFSMVESNGFELKLKSQSINQAIEVVIPIYTEIAKEKDLVLIYNPKVKNAVSYIDERFLTQVLDNLVDNAIKFTNKGEIIITVDSAINDGKKWNLLKVKDTGIGIPEASSKVIFQEFRQVSEGTSRDFEGSGLGLTLAKKITEMMNGDISLESSLGKGSEFTLWLPATEADPGNNLNDIKQTIISSNEIKQFAEQSECKANVLLVEDQMLNVQVTQLYLKPYCCMEYAVSVDSALKMVKNKVYDAILMDINLGLGMSGTQAAKVIRELPGYSKVPIIACTGYAMIGDREKFLKEGFDGYIAKPFEKDTLIQTLKDLQVGQKKN